MVRLCLLGAVVATWLDNLPVLAKSTTPVMGMVSIRRSVQLPFQALRSWLADMQSPL